VRVARWLPGVLSPVGAGRQFRSEILGTFGLGSKSDPLSLGHFDPRSASADWGLFFKNIICVLLGRLFNATIRIMISLEDVKNLAALARVEIGAEEELKLQKDLGSILGYVDELKAFDATVNTSLTTSLVKNVSRADANPHVTGECTNDLLAEAPVVKDNYVAVKKIM
jgi:aspartyl/glutamyl-tRNA(Asn/Gln) amidotransferase C subunit